MADLLEDLNATDAGDSTNEDIENIKISVANERNCPELLSFQGQLVEDLQEMITSQVRAPPQRQAQCCKHDRPAANMTALPHVPLQHGPNRNACDHLRV